MNNMIIGTIVAAAISSVIATVVSIYLNREKKKERFDLQLQNILSYPMKYPYLEQRIFTDTWDPSLVANDERYQRYERYCSIVFNYLVDICSWKKYQQNNIESYIGVKNWLRRHKKYWKNPSSEYENIDVYGKRFSDFISYYI